MNKSDEAYKSIGEVAKILNLVNKKNGSLNTHTIRFWEKEFKIIKPRVLTGRRRYYDNSTILTLKKIISERNVVLFKPSKDFKDYINSYEKI